MKYFVSCLVILFALLLFLTPPSWAATPKISAGAYYSTAIKSDGTLWAWGFNGGWLGDGTTTDQHSPLQIGTDHKWVSVAAGSRNGADFYHTTAIKSDGTLWAWGYNHYGQLGLGSGNTTDQSSPQQIGSAQDWTATAVGTFHTVALKSDGTLWTWGYNFYGQLGYGPSGSEAPNPLPQKVGSATNWVAIAAGYYHTVALKSDGTLWAWGPNNNGQVVTGTDDNRWVAVAAGHYHNVALKSDGTLWAWGENIAGQLGDGSTTYRSLPVLVGNYNKWVAVAAGQYHTVALQSDGTLWAWGSNYYGQLGDGSGLAGHYSPGQVGPDKDWTAISAGAYHTLALKSDGTLLAWGLNANGQLGDGLTTNQLSPESITTVETNWISVTAGREHTLALRSDGTLWGWGFNGWGQIGDGSTTDRLTPVQIGTDNHWTAITAGQHRSIGLKADGTLWGWGDNSYGYLGDGTATNQKSPVRLGTDNQWVQVAGGQYHTVALKSDGSLWAWGENGYGQLGNGTTTAITTPTKIGSDTNWTHIAAGEFHTVALKSNGTLWVWGANVAGQLGDGTTTSKLIPTPIGSDQNWIGIAAGGGLNTGEGHTLAIKSNGTLWAWGDNAVGQLGNGPGGTDSNVPVNITIDNKWLKISGGTGHSIGIKSDGTLWSWGINSWGQVGDGTTTTKYIPTQIGTDRNWVNSASKYGHTLAIKADGSLWAWGLNTRGQLGDGTTTNSSSPKAVPCTYSIFPIYQIFDANGGDGSVNVSTSTDCPWNAVSNASWINIISGASGTTSGTVDYTVVANSGSARNGTITVAGRTFTVYQDAPCTYSLSPSGNPSCPYGGCGGNVIVTTGSGCPWTATDDQTWITVTNGSGTGNGSFDYSVSANGSTSSLSGTITVATQTFSITQAPIPETVSTPNAPSGPSNGVAGISYSFSTGGSTSNYGHSIQYQFNWGDGTFSGWLSVGTVSASHSWSSSGVINITVQARCSTDTGIVSPISSQTSITLNSTISGYVRNTGGNGIPGVVINGLPVTPITDTDGFYSGPIPYNWSGTITPSKQYYTFTPPAAIFSNVTSNISQNFTGTTVSPGDYYVDIANGVDSPDRGGSSGSGAWKTMHYAFSRINIGLPGTYRLYVAPGIYNQTNGEGSDPILINQSNLTIIGGGPTKPKIDGNHGAWAPAFTITNATQNVTIENLEITGFDVAAIKVDFGKTVTIRGNDISQNSKGIFLDTNSPPLIERNKIYDNSNGIELNLNNSSGTVVRNNLVYRNNAGAIQIWNGNAEVYHNTLVGLGINDDSSGIYFDFDAGTLLAKYNIITGFVAGINVYRGSVTSVYNDFWSNNNQDYRIGAGASKTELNNLFLNPLFLDAGNFDFRLQIASPCVNAIPLASGDPITEDLEGKSRPLGAGYDMGAYEMTIFSFTINASTGPNGTIAPIGSTLVPNGGSQTYTITPDPNYHVADVLVDGASQGPISSYNFTNVTDNHTISATFAINTYTISGYVLFNSSGLPGVTLQGLPGNPVTDAGGNYSATVLHGWSGPVTPTLDGYVFSPASSTYTNVVADRGQGYIAFVIPPVPVLTSPANGATGVPTTPATLTWGVSSGTDTYRLQVATNSNFSDLSLIVNNQLSQTSFQPNLQPGTTYYWRVNATNLAGTSDWSSVRSFTTIKTDQTISVTTHAPSNASYNTTFNVAATATSGLGVAITTSGVCSGSGTNSATITMTSGTGTCTVYYNQIGNGNYNAAPQVSESTTAQKIAPTVTFTGAPASAPYLSTFTVAGTTNSSSAPTYSSSGACSNAGTLYSMTSGTGVCTSTATWAVDNNYNGATLSQTTTAEKAGQTITFGPLPNKTYGDPPFSVNASASSGLSVSFNVVSGPASIAGTLVTLTGGGTVTIRASQGGDVNWNVAPLVDQSFTVNPGITITATAGIGGLIAPSGVIPVANRATETFIITPNSGYHIADVKLDGVSIGKVQYLPLVYITEPHTLEALFDADALTSLNISASIEGEGITILPAGEVVVPFKGNQTFALGTSGGFIRNVIVNGLSQGPITSYTFNSITENQTIVVVGDQGGSGETLPSSQTASDFDGDGIPDSIDNCPQTHNPDQSDIDGDGWGDACDTCPGISNPNQKLMVWYKDSDNDGYSNGEKITAYCPPDNTAYKLPEVLKGISGDCNDGNAAINPETPGNYDANCNLIPPQTYYFDVQLTGRTCSITTTRACTSNGDCPAGEVCDTYETWLPAAGRTAGLTVRVMSSSGEINTPITYTHKATNYVGSWTNDPTAGVCSLNTAKTCTTDIYCSTNKWGTCVDKNPDFDAPAYPTNTTINLISRDFGGSITITAKATVAGQSITREITLPKDSNNNGIPDVWENRYGALNPNEDPDGDGLTNFNEYRGVKWIRLVRIEPQQSGGFFKTPAYIPESETVITHIRLNPTRKSLFVKYSYFDAACTRNGTNLDCSNTKHPFALGAAFDSAGIDVYAMKIISGLSENKLDVVWMNNEKLKNYGGSSATTYPPYIIKQSPRFWSWQTKGWSNIGNTTTYGSGSTAYQSALDHYINDKPYLDGLTQESPNVWKEKNASLDPLSLVEDAQDAGASDPANLSKKGDIHILGSYNQQLSPNDIDNDGRVELPFAINAINEAYEYTIQQVLKHTITHEIGHSVGITKDHTPEPACVMYKGSINWSRDDFFGDTSRSQIKIHNQ
jgi:Cys-rich repeat protein/parallel beta-helix repeat protein